MFSFEHAKRKTKPFLWHQYCEKRKVCSLREKFKTGGGGQMFSKNMARVSGKGYIPI